jgi:hypothetical protein
MSVPTAPPSYIHRREDLACISARMPFISPSFTEPNYRRLSHTSLEESRSLSDGEVLVEIHRTRVSADGLERKVANLPSVTCSGLLVKCSFRETTMIY